MDYPITPNENQDQDEIVLDEQDTQDLVELKRKMLETAEKLVDPMTESLNNTQKNALDISDLTKQVRELSGQEIHKKMVLAILDDEGTDMKTKVDLIDHVNDRFDQHLEKSADLVGQLQRENAQNCERATNSWTAPVVIFTCFALGVVVATTVPGGQAILSSAFKAIKRIPAAV